MILEALLWPFSRIVAVVTHIITDKQTNKNKQETRNNTSPAIGGKG